MERSRLTPNKVPDFIRYCKKHKHEVDESFLYEEDLENFEVNDDNPTYIVTNEQEEIVAAASLIMDDYHRSAKKARFRIFHSEINKDEIYNMLLEAITMDAIDLNKLFLFIPVGNRQLIKHTENLNFLVERFSFFLVRNDRKVPPFSLPEGYEIKAFIQGKDEEAYCLIRNTAFATLKGSETPITKEMVIKMTQSSDYLQGGIMLLYHHGIPIGVVRGTQDEYDGYPCMNIGPIAILPKYQGKGLGRKLLRASLAFAQQNGFKQTSLCVNAENEHAKALYVQEGFKEVEAVVCYYLNL